MHSATWLAFQDELQKIASSPAWHSAAEIGGLATLAAPTIQKMRGKPMSEKNTHRAELGGLGVLAAPALHELGSAGLKKLRGLGGKVVHASVKTKRAGSSVWNPLTGAVMDSGAGSRATNRGLSTAASVPAVKKPQFTLSHLKGAYERAGIKPGLKSAVTRIVR